MPFTILSYSQLDSTNEEALRLIANGKAGEFMVVQAEEQTAGRGAGKNQWESRAGRNLTFSIILRPRFLPPARQFVLTQMISLALWNVAARRLDKKALFIKWPNDLWYKDKKLAGVLVQNRINGNLLDFSVLGIGLNVNQKSFVSDAPNPASLIHFTGKEETVSALLSEILRQVEVLYRKIHSDISSLNALYLKKLYRMNQQAVYADAHGRFTAMITGVDSYGRLLLLDSNGNLRTYGFKEVRFL